MNDLQGAGVLWVACLALLAVTWLWLQALLDLRQAQDRLAEETRRRQLAEARASSLDLQLGRVTRHVAVITQIRGGVA